MIKTKTIATVGPASRTPEMLARFLETDVDVVRLNFSHGTLDEHKAVLDTVRRLGRERDHAVAVMGDLSGPKIRLGEVDPDRCDIQTGDYLVIQQKPIIGNNERISTTYPHLIDEVNIDDRVFIDDGHIQLVVESKTADELICRCATGGLLANHKGINLPDTNLDVPALTPKDLNDLEWALENELDYLALSFVRRPEDVRELRERLNRAHSDINIIAKIEKPQAIEHLDEIIDVSDGILVARGDLGVEMDLAQVPLLQKDITKRCQLAGKPVIIATQLLQSMVTSPTPTRAEVSDVANAILDAADAVMLSAESAIGVYPVEALEWLRRISAETEDYQNWHDQARENWVSHRDLEITSSVAHCARMMAERVKPPLVAVWTQSGNSAKLLSKHRFAQPIVALTENPRTHNKLALYYGVIPVMCSCPRNAAEMLERLDSILLENAWVSSGDHIVVVAGTKFEHTGHNNTLLIHQVGKS